MRIPNSFITDLRSNYTDFAVACKLYSLVSSHTKRSSNGYEVCIKQETIAASCKCSVSSVKRSVCRLEEMGIITHKYRLDGSEGRLGAYHYALKPYDLNKNYFYINNRKAYSAELSPKLFYVYAVFCKLMCNDIARFYQSLNDLSALIRLSRAEVSKVIAVLIDRSMVRKQLKRTRAGDYTDNTYFIITRKQGCIKKAGPRSNRSCSNGLCSRGSSQLKQLYNNTSDGICQSFLRKFLLYKPIFFIMGVVPDLHPHIYNPLCINI